MLPVQGLQNRADAQNPAQETRTSVAEYLDSGVSALNLFPLRPARMPCYITWTVPGAINCERATHESTSSVRTKYALYNEDIYEQH
jgi:hypothetical protein